MKREGNAEEPLVEGAPVRLTADGYDHVEFYISTNPGEPLKPLSKVASGGELSRIILALKAFFLSIKVLHLLFLMKWILV